MKREKFSVNAGSVIRKFEVALPSFEWFQKKHDATLDALINEDNAKEAYSGHIGFIVEICDDERTDEEIINSLINRLEALQC